MCNNFVTRALSVVLLSHADQDHIDGLTALLAAEEFDIEVVRANTDSIKQSITWDDLNYELSLLRDKGQIDFEPQLVSDRSGRFNRGDVQVEVLGPSAYLAAKGPGSFDRIGRKITVNSVSAVIRLNIFDKSIALFTGDLDEIGLDDLVARQVDIRAPLLVFPHHGGRVGSAAAPEAFAKKLCEYVAPEHVVFSIGRSDKYPRPEIVRALLECNPSIRISCTQLSKFCASLLPKENPRHLRHIFSKGKEDKKCCAGSIIIQLESDRMLPLQNEHLEFIEQHAPTALCSSIQSQ